MTVQRNRILHALAAVLAAAALTALAVPSLAAAVVYTHESYTEAQKQIAAHQVQKATFNKKAHTVHLTLTDGRHVLASYPSHDEPAIAAQIKATGATVAVEKAKTKPVHHKLRYIAGGILIVVILIVALVLGLNRRKDREEQAAAGADGAVPPAAAGGDTPPPPEPAASEAEPVAGRQPPAG